MSDALSTVQNKALIAVQNLVDQVATNRNFSNLMIGTESLNLCLQALSVLNGNSVDEQHDQLERRMAIYDRLYKQHNGVNPLPDILMAERRLRAIYRMVVHFDESGTLPKESVQQLFDILRRDPGHWGAVCQGGRQ